MKKLLLPILVSFMSMLLLVGCAGQTTPRQTVQVVEANPPANSAPVATYNRLEQQQVLYVIELLELAESAFKANRLTTPEDDNALLYYRQVLRLRPTNEEAHQGVKRIVDRYVYWAQSSLNQGQPQKAKGYLAKAAKVSPQDARLAAMNQQVRKSLAQAAVAKSPDPVKTTSGNASVISNQEPGLYQIEMTALQQHSAQLTAELGAVADTIAEQNARVQIEAPSDQLGRWIYQQLNNRHEEFRVRANLKIANRATVRLLH